MTLQAFLTHNGRLLGPAFPGIRCIKDAAALYPCVGLHSPGEAVRLNFGQRPFLFDLSACVAAEDSKEQEDVDRISVCPSLMRALVRDYLLYQVCGGGSLERSHLHVGARSVGVLLESGVTRVFHEPSCAGDQRRWIRELWGMRRG